MNIQKKTSIIFLLTIILYVSLLIYSTNIMWDRELKRLDKEEAVKNVQVVKTYLNKELNNLMLILKDYAYWDLTYDYAGNPKENKTSALRN